MEWKPKPNRSVKTAYHVILFLKLIYDTGRPKHYIVNSVGYCSVCEQTELQLYVLHTICFVYVDPEESASSAAGSWRGFGKW